MKTGHRKVENLRDMLLIRCLKLRLISGYTCDVSDGKSTVDIFALFA